MPAESKTDNARSLRDLVVRLNELCDKLRQTGNKDERYMILREYRQLLAHADKLIVGDEPGEPPNTS